MSEGPKLPTEKALELFVYAPIGVAMYLRDTVPTFLKLFVSRGRSELQQRRRQANSQVNQARSVGEFTVGFGAPALRRRIEGGLRAARERAEEALEGLSVTREPPAAAPGVPRFRADTTVQENQPAPEATSREARDDEDAPPAATLGIPDYDELSASQVVERLDGLQQAELEAVRSYEETHRGRRTILFKIEQLTA